LEAAPATSGSRLAALEHSGGNRSELETALRKVKGKDTEYLIAHASQYDLVNLTAEQIVENITYARKVRDEAVPYLDDKLDEEMWREWVLPHRVLEEDLGLWRKDFHERMQPVIAGKKATAEVAEAIRFWLWGGGGSARRVVAGEAENRLRDPISMLQGGTASCGELALLHVSFLRAVGIPARHCSSGWWGNKDGWHFYTEYWDSQLKRWVATDDVPVTPAARVLRGDWQPLVAHAVPGFHDFANAYYAEDFRKMLDVTENLGEMLSVRFQVPDRNGGPAGVGIWNTGTWRKVAMPESDGPGASYKVELAPSKRQKRPVLLTVVQGNELIWGFANPVKSRETEELQPAKAGVCIRWPAVETVEDVGGESNTEP